MRDITEIKGIFGLCFFQTSDLTFVASEIPPLKLVGTGPFFFKYKTLEFMH